MAARWLPLVLLVLTGCSRATLPYAPDPQPRGATISAAYQLVGDRLRVEIDTGGRPLEQAWIIRPDGTSVGVQAIENPPVVTGPGSSVSIGVGGGSFGGGHHGGGFGVGTGVGVGFPVGAPSSRIAGNTVVWFPLAQAGPAPWQLYVKVGGVEPVQFPVGGP